MIVYRINLSGDKVINLHVFERVGLMTWWLRVRSPVEATFLSGVFSPLTSAEACEESSRWLWKEKLC